MAVGALTPDRALRRPLRLDGRALVGLLVLLLAFAGGEVFWTASSQSRPVLVATRDLPAGATLQPSDVQVSQVQLPDDVYSAAVAGGALATAVGKQVSEPVHAHQVLTQAQLTSRPAIAAGQLALTIPVSPTTAAGGGIQAGDQVEVLVTTSKGRPDSKTSVVLPRVEVYRVGYQDQSTGITGNAGSADASRGPVASLTLLVTNDQAVQLAQARWNGDLDAALLPGEDRH